MYGHPDTPRERGNLYYSYIMQVGQSLTANKNELAAELAAGAPKEDLKKMQEAVGKDKEVLEKWRTLATHVALPVGYQLTLMEVR